MAYDLYIEIEYDPKQDSLSITNTNVKRGEIKSLLESWLAGQIGRGEDNREPNKQQKYHLKLEVDLNEDIFAMQSDTGNRGLTAGIILDCLDSLILPPEQQLQHAQTLP